MTIDVSELSVREWTSGRAPELESIFGWQASPIRFGLGATDGVGAELARLGVKRALIVTDPGVAATGLADRVRELATAHQVSAEVWDGVDVEPTDVSIARAVEELKGERFDGFVGLGGGSSLDTCKIVDLLLTHGGSLDDYITAPHGRGRKVPAPLQPLVGIPTTAGTGSECSAIAIVNLTERHVKGAVSDVLIRPALAIVDPLNTVSGPAWATASSGYDALIQTLESYTSTPFNRRGRLPLDAERPLYAGSTPISDVWNEKALSLLGQYLPFAILDPNDLDARAAMALGSLFSRLGTAGAHVPHSAGYAIAGLVKSYRPAQLGDGPALVPHGMSVAVTAAAAFDFTYAGAPERHNRAVQLVTGDKGVDVAPELALGIWLRDLLATTGGPRGIDEFGYTADDVQQLAITTLTQTRLLAGAPRALDVGAVAEIFNRSFSR
jgi:hydroxyacid-oxoacid transhydrogenase